MQSPGACVTGGAGRKVSLNMCPGIFQAGQHRRVRVLAPWLPVGDSCGHCSHRRLHVLDLCEAAVVLFTGTSTRHRRNPDATYGSARVASDRQPGQVKIGNVQAPPPAAALGAGGTVWVHFTQQQSIIVQRLCSSSLRRPPPLPQWQPSPSKVPLSQTG
jgi:hypothetical protein